MDVALVPVKSLAEADLTAARESAVLIFSDWETVLHPGVALVPGTDLQRLKFPAFPATFPLTVKKPGHYALFTQHHPDEFTATLRRDLADPATTLDPVWSHVFKPDHEHDDEVSSVGITTPGDVDPARLNDWIGELLRVKGNDIFRSKGVLAVKGSPNRLVFQGVHMLFDGKFDRPWGKERRTNTLIFIGRNLDREALHSGFRACLA